MSDFYGRLRNEQAELREKKEKLRAFIWDGNATYESLPKVDQHLLINQLSAMQVFSSILEQRLNRS